MKRIFIYLLVVLFSSQAQAQSSLSNLPAASSVDNTDLFYIVKTPGLGGVKATLAQIAAAIAALGPPIKSTGYVYGLGQGTIAIAGGGTGYAGRDLVTLTCANATFTTNPVVAITHATGGVADGVSVVNPGVATSIGAYNCTFTQSSTTGSGVGATFTGTLLPTASVLSLPTLLTGGAASNGNTFIGGGTPSSTLGTGENTFLGDFAGASFGGTAQGNTALGSYSCGIGANTTATGNFNLCVGRNAGRNMSGAANTNTLVGDSAAGNENGTAFSAQNDVVVGSTGIGITTGSENTLVGVGAGLTFSTAAGNTLVGYNAGNVLTTGFNTILGYQAGLNITTSAFGGNHVLLGADAGQNITTGFNDVIIGQGAASSTLTTGAHNVVIGTSNGCDTANSGDNNTLTLCAGAGALLHITGGGTPSTSSWTLNGSSFSVPGVLSLANGGASTPAINFGDSGSGFWRPSLNQIALSVGGTPVWSFDSNGMFRPATDNAFSLGSTSNRMSAIYSMGYFAGSSNLAGVSTVCTVTAADSLTFTLGLLTSKGAHCT